MKNIKIGCGAGYGGDRYEPAIELVDKGDLDYLVYECMAERTVSLYQQEKLKDSQLGYNPQLESRLSPILKKCHEKGIKIITNMGAANPKAAVDKVHRMASEMGLKGLKIACVLGDDVLDVIKSLPQNPMLEKEKTVKDYLEQMISANAYLGIDGIVDALEAGADIIITGRVADPSLFLAPMVYEFKWHRNDYDLLGQGTVLGHLLECGGQVCGGYFADPGYKNITDLWNLGFPIVEVDEKGDGVVTKVEGTGGLISLGTCKEQLLYEIHDPANYITPDCIADFTAVKLTEVGKDMIKVTGGSGKEKPKDFKVSIGYKDSYFGSGEISYGGPGAAERAMLAKEVVEKRLEIRNIKYSEIHYDLMGMNSLFSGQLNHYHGPNEIRLRVAAKCNDRLEALKIGEEVETLWTNGPYGGGGARKEVREVIGIISTLIPRDKVDFSTYIREVN